MISIQLTILIHLKNKNINSPVNINEDLDVFIRMGDSYYASKVIENH